MPSIPFLPSVLESVWSPWKYCSKGLPIIARKRYAEKAPGKTLTYPKALSSGLSSTFEILYSKFCTATSGLSTAEVAVIVKAFPERQQGARAGLGSGVDENGDFWVENAAKGVEQPAMRIDLLAVLLLQTEDELHGREIAMRLVGVRSDELLIGRDGDLTRVLENVCHRFLAVDVLLQNAILVDTNSCKDVENVLVHFVETIKDKTHHDLLPSWTSLVPELGALKVHNVSNILHRSVERSREEHLVLVVIGDGDEELGVTVVHARTEVEAVAQGEVVRVTCSSCVAHLCEFLLHAPRAVAVPRLDSVLDGAGDWVVDAENGTLDQLDLSGL
ncbi:hypothetical protein HG530_006796 [Fusarium avenaceum]|nr:hypothetical protein HG530_006796 [Fusarium avenaceum]